MRAQFSQSWPYCKLSAVSLTADSHPSARLQRHAHQLQEPATLFVGPSRGHDRDIHSPRAVNLHVIDFDENILVKRIGPESGEVEINYPVEQYPVKVTSFNLDKTPVVEGQLKGIKGQYLIFDTGVINMRKYGGYKLALSVL